MALKVENAFYFHWTLPRVNIFKYRIVVRSASRMEAPTMLERCLHDIANLLDVNIDEMTPGQPLFTDPRYIAKPFDKSNFKPFDPCPKDAGPTPGEPARVAFVDGGNLEILRAPNFSVSLVRVYFNIFDGKNERVAPTTVPPRMEFFVTAFASMVDGKMYYSGILHPMDDSQVDYLPSGEHLMVDSMDRAIATGGFRADISIMGQITRRAAEWSLAGHVMREELEKGDLMVRDGTLQTAVTNEKYYAKPAYDAADGKGVLLSGLAKTSMLFTTTGLSLLAAVHKLAQDNGLKQSAWYYNPLAENHHPDHPAEMFVTKLHPDTKYVFRYELYKPQVEAMSKEQLDGVFLRLGRNSSDLSFLGYPYGLVEADLSARVHYADSDWLKGMVSNTLSNMSCYDKICRHLQATNAHDVLDTI